MGKKIIFTLFCILTAISFVFAAGCNNKEKDPDGDHAVREKVVVIADFEEWAPDFQLIRTIQNFGAMHVNTDLQYVKSGKQSLQLHPLGGYTSGSVPIIFFPMKSDLFDFDYSDFSDVDNLAFEFYNNEETDVKVAIGLVTDVQTVDYISKTSMSFQSLHPGWNSITYSVNVSALSIDCDIKNIVGVYVAFENVRSREEADAPDIYMDDFIMYRKDEPDLIVDLVQLDDDEYMDFEKDWQEYAVSIRSTANAPDINIVKASDYTVSGGEKLQAVSGEKVLRVLAPQGTANAGSYPGITFSAKLLQKSLFGRLKLEDLGAVSFELSVYNNSDYSTHAGITFYNSTETRRIEYGEDFAPHQWMTISFNLKDLYNSYKAATNQTDLFTDPGTLQIYWPEFTTEGSRELFFDNFRFVVEEKDMQTKPKIILSPFVRVAKVGTSIDLPSMTVTDKYDFNFNTSMQIFYSENDEWTEIELRDGRIPIDKAGDYKLVVFAKNSFGNTTQEEYPFKGVAEVENAVFAGYDFADEASNVYLYGDAGEKNNATYLEDTSKENLNGETKYGVIKAQTNNADIYGAGYIGFRFADELLNKAKEQQWVSIVIDVYIEASVNNMNIYSFNKCLQENIPTNCWTQIKLTKQMLNGQTWINMGMEPINDSLFYESFAEICGTDVSRLLFTTSVKSNSADSVITYYIDKVVWVPSSNVNYGDADDWVEDIYPDDYVDKWEKDNAKDDAEEDHSAGGQGGPDPD